MNPRRPVDTNVIVRHLTQDHPAHSSASDRLFAACDRGDLTLILLPAVLAECVYVLESFYKYSRQSISQMLTVLLSSPAIEIDRLQVHVGALQCYSETNLQFVDCVIAAYAAADALPVASFDKDLGKRGGVQIDLST